MKKAQVDKQRWDLINFKSLDEVVATLTMGAKKYGDFSYHVLDDAENIYFAATMRHLTAFKCGEWDDEESGIPHLAHAIADLLILMDIFRPIEEDD